MEGYWMKEKATSRGRMSSEKKLGTWWMKIKTCLRKSSKS